MNVQCLLVSVDSQYCTFCACVCNPQSECSNRDVLPLSGYTEFSACQQFTSHETFAFPLHQGNLNYRDISKHIYVKDDWGSRVGVVPCVKMEFQNLQMPCLPSEVSSFDKGVISASVDDGSHSDVGQTVGPPRQKKCCHCNESQMTENLMLEPLGCWNNTNYFQKCLVEFLTRTSFDVAKLPS